MDPVREKEIPDETPRGFGLRGAFPEVIDEFR
jgi:hypothetical protein